MFYKDLEKWFPEKKYKSFFKWLNTDAMNLTGSPSEIQKQIKDMAKNLFGKKDILVKRIEKRDKWIKSKNPVWERGKKLKYYQNRYQEENFILFEEEVQKLEKEAEEYDAMNEMIRLKDERIRLNNIERREEFFKALARERKEKEKLSETLAKELAEKECAKQIIEIVIKEREEYWQKNLKEPWELDVDSHFNNSVNILTEQRNKAARFMEMLNKI